MEQDSLFLKIARGEIPAKMAYRDDEYIAFHDINPQAPVHILIVPLKLIKTTNDVADEDAALVGKMVIIAKNLAREHGLAEGGYRLVFNCNQDGGQSVPHIHLHLLGGRALQWPPG